MDPASDFLWTSLTCGGPDVASFICELPVPSWAMGPQGCLLTELPSLTVLYIPEQLALELTSDCGLDGTKRIACKGNANREEILQHLTCAMPPDDFDDKSTTKLPSPSNPPMSSESSSESNNALSSKTTKPWIWTSNTIDIDYGMPTRHRRETENTLNPLSTKSTTDLSVQQSQSDKFVSTGTQQDLEEVYVTSISPKIAEFKSTQIMDFTGENGVTENDQEESSLGVEDTGEYPSAIGQGQLFSIIENGTMFDIIELNDTTSEDDKAKDLEEAPQLEKETIKSATLIYTQEPSGFPTTAMYPQEAPSDTEIETNKSIKKDNSFKKRTDVKKNKVTTKDKKENASKTLESLSKEVNLFPITGDSMVKLNRTFRKEVPFVPADDDKGDFMVPRLPTFSTNNLSDNHHHVEVKWNDGKSSSQNSLFITTKRGNLLKENIEEFEIKENSDELHRIDSKINLLNNFNVTPNNDSEVLALGKLEKIKNIPDQEILMKEQFLPKTLLGEENVVSTTEEDNISSTESTEPEPEAQPRPNRQRQLTRPQRRSFYPNFFSRVLG